MLQQHTGGLTLRVLGHEFALEGVLENGLAQPFGTFQVGRNNGFKFINDRETALKLGDDATLLSKRGTGIGKSLTSPTLRWGDALPPRQCLRLMKTENPTAARFEIQSTGEARFYSRALVTERERPHWSRKMGGESFAVLPSLGLNAGQRRSFSFGFDHANCLLIDVEQIVRKAVSRPEGKFADRDANASVKVCSRNVLDEPARLLKHLIDGYARLPFRVFHLILSPSPAMGCRD
jgi:hypothetical protein